MTGHRSVGEANEARRISPDLGEIGVEDDATHPAGFGPDQEVS
jgi:hypothetical protein